MSAEEPGGAAEADHIQLLHWPNDPHLSQVHLVTKTPLVISEQKWNVMYKFYN